MAGRPNDWCPKRTSGAVAAAMARGEVASFEMPRRVLSIDEFPMTAASAKIREVELRERAKAALAEGG